MDWTGTGYKENGMITMFECIRQPSFPLTLLGPLSAAAITAKSPGPTLLRPRLGQLIFEPISQSHAQRNYGQCGVRVSARGEDRAAPNVQVSYAVDLAIAVYNTQPRRVVHTGCSDVVKLVG